MRILLNSLFIVVIAASSTVNAQIRTPIATVPQPVSTAGPAPYNVRVTATSPSSATISWDAVSGARGYTVDRALTDDPACCVAHSGLITAPSWTDASLVGGQQYSFVITALYSDGRVGTTQAVVATPMPGLPVVRVPRGAEVSSAEGSLRLTACGLKSGAGAGPSTVNLMPSPPSGAVLSWLPVYGTDMNYVIDRAPEGTTTWTLVGSTCGGPSPVRIAEASVSIRDLAGGVVPNTRYVYRVYAISSTGAAGWNTYHFQPPCAVTPTPVVTVAGSTITVKWTPPEYLTCGGSRAFTPDSYTLTSSFGFVKSGTGAWLTETVYGVPLGTHTFTLVANYRTGFSTTPVSANATVAY